MTMSDPRIRKAKIADAEALATCIDNAYARFANRLTDLPPVSQGCAEDIVENQVWVAVELGKIIGGLVIVSHEDSMKIANVVVHPDHGGKGLGRKLIYHACSQAKNQGYDEIKLNTHVAMPENLRLYAHLGFEEVLRKGNTVSMRKFLGSN